MVQTVISASTSSPMSMFFFRFDFCQHSDVFGLVVSATSIRVIDVSVVLVTRCERLTSAIRAQVIKTFILRVSESIKEAVKSSRNLHTESGL